MRYYLQNNQNINFFNNNFNNTEIKCLSAAYKCRNSVAVLNKFDTNRVTILIVKKHLFSK